MTANASETSKARNGEGSRFFACLMPYQGGYALNMHATYSKASGAFGTATLGATLAREFVGNTNVFIPNTIKEIVAGVKATGAVVTLLEAYP